MNANQVLANAILQCKPLLTRYLADFSDANHTAQPAMLPNHVAWTLGHLALTMHRAAEKIDGVPPTDSDFIVGSAAGDQKRFGTDSVAFNSHPSGDPTRYPSLARSVEIYERACDRLAHLVVRIDEDGLKKLVQWGSGETTVEALISRMVFHNGMHCGQIADTRRALAMKSIFA
jgi:hypothetical protein